MADIYGEVLPHLISVLAIFNSILKISTVTFDLCSISVVPLYASLLTTPRSLQEVDETLRDVLEEHGGSSEDEAVRMRLICCKRFMHLRVFAIC